MAIVVIAKNTASGPVNLGPFDAGYPLAKARIAQVSGSHTDKSYRFPYAPVQVTFTGLGSEYQEIARPGDYALINRRAPSLLRPAFEFRIAHRPSNGLQSIERDMDILQLMALEDVPVAVVGMGAFFADVGESHHTLFRISKLDITVVRRGPNNEPWQADGSIELIEDRNPAFLTIGLGSIDYSETPVARTASKSTTGNKRPNTPTPPATPAPEVDTYTSASEREVARSTRSTAT